MEGSGERFDAVLSAAGFSKVSEGSGQVYTGAGAFRYMMLGSKELWRDSCVGFQKVLAVGEF